MVSCFCRRWEVHPHVFWEPASDHFRIEGRERGRAGRAGLGGSLGTVTMRREEKAAVRTAFAQVEAGMGERLPAVTVMGGLPTIRQQGGQISPTNETKLLRMVVRRWHAFRACHFGGRGRRRGLCRQAGWRGGLGEGLRDAGGLLSAVSGGWNAFDCSARFTGCR